MYILWIYALTVNTCTGLRADSGGSVHYILMYEYFFLKCNINKGEDNTVFLFFIYVSAT